jgi:uncharacterized protein (DUF433 family)
MLGLERPDRLGLEARRFSRVPKSCVCGKMTDMEPNATPRTETLETPHIVRTPGVCGGKPRIDGHRINVEHVAICHERIGMSPDEIVTAHPTISLGQVHAALAYYYEHREKIDSDIEAGIRFVDELKAKSPPSKLQQFLEPRKANGSSDTISPG